MMRAILLLLFVLPCVCGSGDRGVWHPISDAVGVPSSSAMFPDAATSVTFCNRLDMTSCKPVESNNTCMSKEALVAAFQKYGNPAALASQSSRNDIIYRIEAGTYSDTLSHTQILTILLTEVLGFGVQIQSNEAWAVQVQRCRDRLFDFHVDVWQSDFTPEEWTYTFGRGDSSQLCQIVGLAKIGQDGWYADTYSVTQAASKVPILADGTQGQPVILDYWRAYSTPQGVAGLPRLNVTEAQSDNLNHWFIPPQCLVDGAQCGVAYGIDIGWDASLPQQQVVNLKWLVAIVFFVETGVEVEGYPTFFKTILNRTENQQQSLFFYGANKPFTAGETFTHVPLPTPSPACAVASTLPPAYDGIGPMSCDFEALPVVKVMTTETDSDRADGIRLFENFQISHADLISMMTAAKQNKPFDSIASVPDVGCQWVQNHTAVWVPWIFEATPRKHLVSLSNSSSAAIYTLLGIYLAISLACHVLLYVYRQRAVIRRSSHFFDQLVTFGSIVLNIALILTLQGDSVDRCIAEQVLLSIGFTAFYLSLLAKSYRISVVFTSVKLQVVTLTDLRLFSYLGIYLLFDLGVVIIWVAYDPPAKEIVSHSTTAYALVSQCHSHTSQIFLAILYLLRGLVLIIGAGIAVRIRNVAENYNESKYLAAITYNIVIVSAIVLGTSQIASNDPLVTIGLYTAGLSLAVLFSLLMLVVPKLYVVLSKQVAAQPQGGSQSDSNTIEGGKIAQPRAGTQSGSNVSGSGEKGARSFPAVSTNKVMRRTGPAAASPRALQKNASSTTLTSSIPRVDDQSGPPELQTGSTIPVLVTSELELAIASPSAAQGRELALASPSAQGTDDAATHSIVVSPESIEIMSEEAQEE